MKIEYLSPHDLVPYDRNSRTHAAWQIAQIAASIEEFGFVNPILLGGDGVIVAGHGRLAAAQQLDLESVPVIRLAHLSPAQQRALVIADNKIAENAGWDEEMLRIEMFDLNSEGFDLKFTGFDDAEISALMTEPDFAPGTEEDQGRLDKQTRVSCPQCGEIFDPVEHKTDV